MNAPRSGGYPAGLGVVVLTHGTAGEFAPLVASLLEEGVPPTSIAIVQNPISPSDPDVDRPNPQISVLRMEGNLGYAGGMNAGIRHHLARGERLLLLLTHDVRLRPGALAALTAAAERKSRYGILGPVLWARDEAKVFSYGGRRSRSGSVGHVREGPSDAPSGIVDQDWVDGAVLLIRAEVIDQLGPLDERFFIYFEETELCLRATRADWRVGVVMDAVAEQSSGQPSRPGVHAYLLSRNGFEYGRLVAGMLGVLAAVRRALVESWELARSYPGSSEPERAASRVKLAGMWLGFLDFLRRRFGPPPAFVWTLGGADDQ